MAIRTTVVGSYPKPPDEGQSFTLRKTLHALERDEATVEDVHAAQRQLVHDIIREQVAAGIDVVTDGQAAWEDIVTPFARHMAGFEIGGLLRFFDNNTYYRRPICTGEIEWRGPATVDQFAFAASVSPVPVKAVVPGPVTFARLSVDEYYADHESFVLAIARVLAQEVFELQAAGATLVQIDEPFLPHAPEDMDLAVRAISLITEQLTSASSLVATYFADTKRISDRIADLPVDGFAFDLVSGPDNLEVIRSLPDTTKVQAGVVDARNTKLEGVDELAATIADLAAMRGTDALFMSPSAGLEYLPREKARAKLERLVEAAEKVGA